MNIKKVIAIFFKIILSEKYYNNRHVSKPYLVYYRIEKNVKFLLVFLRTFYIRLIKIKFILLPTKHLVAYICYKKFMNISEINKENIFLFGAALRGVERNQGACAGSAKDLDLCILLEEGEFEIFKKCLIKNYNEKKLKFLNNDNSVHILFTEYSYYIDLVFFKKKQNVYTSKSSYPYPKCMNFNESDFLPSKNRLIYGIKAYIPNNSKKILKILFGENWINPDKKKQVYISEKV